MRKRFSRRDAGLITAVLSGLAMAGAAAAPAGADTLPPYYQLVNHDGKCLDVPGGSSQGGQIMQQWSCNGNEWQYWDVIPTGYYGGGQLIENYYTKKCLSVDGDTQPGAPVVQENCTADSASQNWYPEYTGSGSWDQYWNVASCDIAGNNECGIHPSGGGTTDGKKIYVQYPNAANSLSSFSWELGAQVG